MNEMKVAVNSTTYTTALNTKTHDARTQDTDGFRPNGLDPKTLDPKTLYTRSLSAHGGNVTRGQLDSQSGTMTYQLSQPSRILFRAGMASGLLYKTIVDWEPRASGAVTEYWNGRDEDNLLDVPSI